MAALLALPWLSPFAPSPSPAVGPWLVTLACVGVLLLFQPWRRIAAPSVVATAWLAAALLSAAIGLCQYFGVEHLLAPWMNLSDGQAYANLRQRNQFATLLAIGLLSLLWWAGRARARGAAWLAVAGAAAVLAVGLSASASRTGLLALLLVLLLALPWGWWRQPAQRMVLLGTGAAYALAVWLLPWLAGHDPARSGILGRFQDEGCGSRLILWRNVLELIVQRPWTGWGWGELDYAHFMHLYAGPRFCQILGNAHNLPLHLAVELGLPLALLIVVGALWLLLRARPWRERDAARQLAWGVLAVLALHSLLEYPLWYGPFALAAALCLALLKDGGAPAPALPVAASVSRVLAALLLLAGVGYAAWDYQRVRQIYLPAELRAPAYRDGTLEKIRASWLFREQARFAGLSLAPLSRDNAAEVNAMAHAVLHYSPEAGVVEKLIESAVLLGRDDEALLFLARYRAAYPEEYTRWRDGLHPAIHGATHDGPKHQGKHLE